MNRLAHETSPYLLQHAHNPVDWYPWGEEALQKARQEDKPILVSIGYSACHWCHVMEKESFEDPETASIMNQFFVNIKIDREERPDIDQIYMDAIQAISGSGGWPLNCFLTPDLKPFYGGTYFPPKPYYNRPSWKSILANVAKTFIEKRAEIEDQAEKLFEHLVRSGNFMDMKVEQETFLHDAMLDTVFFALQKRFDKTWGGFGHAPKFPSTMSLKYLLRYYYYKKNPAALEQVQLSLDKMMRGGLYDVLGGGFSRYSVDDQWHIPHFEKMLYDNALLLRVYGEAYQITQNKDYLQVIEETITYLQREMTSPEGGFYAAQDADSEGVEGKYFVWTKTEIDLILGSDAELFCAYYNITEVGNWEHGNNVCIAYQSIADFAQHHKLEVGLVHQQLAKSREKLFEVREKRIKPGLDDKILLSWNALMLGSIAKMYKITQNQEYYDLMLKNADFLLQKMTKGDILYRTYKNGEAKILGFLEDYAYFIEALLEVYETTFKEEYLNKAISLLEYTLQHFFDPQDNAFFYTSALQTDILFRQKEFYDNATPSANSTMAHNLLRLGALLGNKYTELAHTMVQQIKGAILQYPNAFGKWATLLSTMVHGVGEVAYFGDIHSGEINKVWKQFHPELVFAGNGNPATTPFLKDKVQLHNQDTFYFCKNHTCQTPVHTAQEIEHLVQKSLKKD